MCKMPQSIKQIATIGGGVESTSWAGKAAEKA